MAVLSDYVSGTITLTNGSDAFTGSGTAWQLAQIGEGDAIFYLPGTAYEGVISTITSNVAGTLQRPWEGPDLSNVAYRIRLKPDGSRATAQSAMLRETLGNGNNLALAGINGVDGLVPVFTGPGAMTGVPRSEFINGARFDVQVDTLADRATYDAQPAGYAVLVADNGDGRSALYSKVSNTSGDWSDPAFITGPQGEASTVPGVVWRGVYDAGTTYAINDGVRFNGSSFRKLTTSAAGTAPSSASPPVDNANWAVLAAKGADGSGTGDVVGPATATNMSIAGFDGATGKLIRELTSAQATSYLALFTTAKGLVPGATSGDVTANRLLRADGTWADPPSTSGDLEFVLAQVLLKLADMDNQAQFLGPSGNRFADSFDTLTYVDVAGATNLDTSEAGILRSVRGAAVLIPQATGTNIGNMTSGNGLAGAFDASLSTVAQGSGDGTSYVGKTYSGGRLIGQVIAQSRTGAGFNTSSSPAPVTLTIYAKNGAVPASSTDGTIIGATQTSTVVSDAKTFFISNTGPWDHVWVRTQNTTFNEVAELRFYEPGVMENLTVRSAPFSAATTPTKMKSLINVREVVAAVAGTDYTLECSRDNGTTWTAMALTERYTMPTSGLRVVEAAEAAVSGQPSGTAPRWRFRTLNNANVELHDIYLYWS